MNDQEQKNYRQIHYSWKHRLVAAVSRRTNFTYTIRHGLATGMKRQGGLAFLPSSAETAETRFIRDMKIAGSVVYDIGAFEGIFTMFFSQRARQVISYEPNPQSRRKLQTNLKLNNISNVTIRDVALSDNQTDATLVFDPLMPGAASGAKAVSAQIREHAPEKIEVPVHCTRLDDEIFTGKLPAPDLLKVDVEGMEGTVLRGAERTLKTYHPALYIEMHGADREDKLRIARDVISLLRALDYRNILDVEAGTPLGQELVNPPSHLYCASTAQHAASAAN